jgi:hypothetical protein
MAQAITLPGGVVLAKDETVVASGEFLTSNIFVFIKLKLALTTKRLAGEKPNTFLGFIPVGSEKVSYPISNIAGVQTSTRVLILPLVLGLLFGIGGFSQGVSQGWFAILVSVLLLLSSYSAELVIMNSGGGTIRHRVAVFNRSSAQVFAQEINTALASRS